jgi:large subunit ribosomal protein L10
MSKVIKQMEMDVLKRTFQDVRDFVVLSTEKLSCQANDQLRAALRKKSIRLQMVKNSLARRVFDELGMKLSSYWQGTSLLAWGAGSLSELSRELDTLLKKNDRVKVKGAISEGQEVTFQAAREMPTRAEAVGRVIGLALGPASHLVGQILGPASQVAGQIKTLSEKKPPEEGVQAAEPAPAPAD